MGPKTGPSRATDTTRTNNCPVEESASLIAEQSERPSNHSSVEILIRTESRKVRDKEWLHIPQELNQEKCCPGVAHHSIDLVLIQCARSCDLDLRRLASALIHGRHVQDAVGVDVESDLDLGDATWRRGDAVQPVESAQR
jgi:hypothetical protein